MVAWDLRRFATGSNGLLVLGDNYPDGYSPFRGMMDPATQFADPDPTPGFRYSKFDMGDILNNGVTFLLVQNFTGYVNDDIDADNDGILNLAGLPFTLMIDSVSVPEIDGNNALVPGRGGYSFAKPDIVVAGKHYNADNLSRIRGNTSANSPT